MLIFDQRHFPKNMLLVIFSKSLNVARKIEKTNQKKTACVQLVSSYFFFQDKLDGIRGYFFQFFQSS